MKKKDIITRLQDGGRLHFEYGANDERRWFIDNRTIRSTQAAKIIAELHMISAGDCLFAELDPQSWRLP